MEGGPGCGWWLNHPAEKICLSNWIIFARIGNMDPLKTYSLLKMGMFYYHVSSSHCIIYVQHILTWAVVLKSKGTTTSNWKKKLFVKLQPPNNIEPDNDASQKESPFPGVHFQVPMSVFREIVPQISTHLPPPQFQLLSHASLLIKYN